MAAVSKNGNRTQSNTARRTGHADPQPVSDAIAYVKRYAREKPDVAALWCFGIGFVVGWKIKPW